VGKKKSPPQKWPTDTGSKACNEEKLKQRGTASLTMKGSKKKAKGGEGTSRWGGDTSRKCGGRKVGKMTNGEKKKK